MPSYGIYTLANDAVYDQLVALLNSIEQNVDPNIPVLVIPYNDRTEKVQQEIATRPNVSLYHNPDSIRRWESFAQHVWAVHPKANQKSSERLIRTRIATQRKFTAFDGPVEQFVFYDADSLAMKPLAALFDKLQTYDFVFDDWEPIKRGSATALDFALVEPALGLTATDLYPKMHCTSFFGSKQGLFAPEELAELQRQLVEQREITWVNYLSESFLGCYLTLRYDRPMFNFTLSPDGRDRTGNCADADPFVEIDHVLYNQDGLKPIHRLHYMNYAAVDFARLSQGEDVDIHYKDIFLHYRFLKQPEQKPTVLKPPKITEKMNRSLQTFATKVKRVAARLK